MPDQPTPREYARSGPPPVRWVYERLQTTYGSPQPRAPHDPFALLVHTILSQHTNDKNSDKAFADLQSALAITPQVLATVSVSYLGAKIRRAGLWRIKAERIRNAAKAVLEQFNGDLDPVLQQSLPQARSALLSIPGVGFKTADILLLFYSRRPVIPLDTHCLRVSHRLGYGDGKDYEATRARLENGLPHDYKDYYAFHTGLITHGRRICHAQHPQCQDCVLAPCCPSAGSWARDHPPQPYDVKDRRAKKPRNKSLKKKV